MHGAGEVVVGGGGGKKRVGPADSREGLVSLTEPNHPASETVTRKNHTLRAWLFVVAPIRLWA